MAVKPPDLAEYETSMKRVAAIRILHRRAEADFKKAKADADAKKKKADQLQMQFNQAMDEEMEPNLFSQGIRPSEEEIQKVAEEEEAKIAAAVATAPIAQAAGSAPATGGGSGSFSGEPEAWRSVSIDVLGIPQKAIEALKAHAPNGKSAGLDTLGGLAEFQSQDRHYTDIKGIGKATAEKIADAVIDWIAKNKPNELTPADPHAPATPPAIPAEGAEAPPAEGGDAVAIAEAKPEVDEHGFPTAPFPAEEPAPAPKKGGKKK